MRKPLSLLLALLFALAFSGAGCQCGPGPEELPDGGQGGGGGEDGGDPTQGTDAGLQFTGRTEVFRDGGVIFERLEYESGGLLIKAELCRPEDDGSTPHPMLVRNHAGWQGLGANSFDALCIQLAKDGIVVASSSYRGEDGSEGSVEFCDGEVDDVLRFTDILRKESFVRADRVATMGAEHGGCISLFQAIRDPKLVAAVDIAGVGNLATAHKFWDRQVQYNEPAPCRADAGDDCARVHRSLLTMIETAVGGRPSQFPLSYEKRSPTLQLGLSKVPLLIVQAENDIVTSVQQACAKRVELESPSVDGGTARAVSARYLNAALVSSTPSFQCGGAFQTGSTPDPKQQGSLSDASTYLFIYGGQEYPFGPPADDHAQALVLRFLVDRLNAP